MDENRANQVTLVTSRIGPYNPRQRPGRPSPPPINPESIPHLELPQAAPPYNNLTILALAASNLSSDASVPDSNKQEFLPPRTYSVEYYGC